MLIKTIAAKQYTKANEIIREQLRLKIECRLVEAKKALAAMMYSEVTDFEEVPLDEAARFKIVRARIRNGKVQRRKKVATADGYTFRGGKLKRMSVRERRNRRMAQRRAKIKRRAKLGRALRKRKLSLIKRKRLGV